LEGQVEVSFWFFVLISILKVIIVTGILLTAVAYTVLLERKVVGRIQNRWGPSRVGPFGLLQPLADGPISHEDSMAGTARLLTDASARLARAIGIGQALVNG
jgi:hypothetical protein